MSLSRGSQSPDDQRASLLSTLLSRAGGREPERDDLALAAMDDRLTVGAAPADRYDHEDHDGDRAAD